MDWKVLLIYLEWTQSENSTPQIFLRNMTKKFYGSHTASCAIWNCVYLLCGIFDQLKVSIRTCRINKKQIEVKIGKLAKSSLPFKVHIFWEGHKNLRNLHCRFGWHYIGQIYGGDFSKFCGLLRIYELYLLQSISMAIQCLHHQNSSNLWRVRKISWV